MSCLSNARKYHAVKVEIDGVKFDSKRESKRYEYLKLLRDNGEITGLVCHPSYTLVPAQRIDGKIKERAIVYTADFAYDTTNGIHVVEDVKGFKTKDYIIKRKLMLWVHDIEVVEV